MESKKKSPAPKSMQRGNLLDSVKKSGRKVTPRSKSRSKSPMSKNGGYQVKRGTMKSGAKKGRSTGKKKSVRQKDPEPTNFIIKALNKITFVISGVLNCGDRKSV